MTVHAFIPAQRQESQPTAATSYYDSLMKRFEQQSQLNVPRSRMAWGAEQNRLGSWGTGLGTMRALGVGPSYSNGVGRPLFAPDDEERQ